MAEVTITLKDTPTGGVYAHSTYTPAVGHPLTPAQAAALEMMNRTTREWGVPATQTQPQFDNCTQGG